MAIEGFTLKKGLVVGGIALLAIFILAATMPAHWAWISSGGRLPASSNGA
ncbi:MAG: hypothetical protein KAV87_51570 [Desulfobacteraceae bacterium]|nr:hypothetical protein [Desulfobacteraceae bacterium]